VAAATRAPAAAGPMPPLPDDDPSIRRAVLDQVSAAHERVRSLVHGAREVARRDVPRAMRHPAAVAATAARNAQALGRMMKPPTERLSPIMVERRGWWRYATLDVDLTAMRAAARSQHATLNDAFLAALAEGFARYHDEHGTPVRQLRAAVAVNTRQAGDSPYGNHVRGGSILMPVGVDDPAAYMAIAHDAVTRLREDVAQPLAGAAGTALALLGPFVSGLMGRIMKHCDFAASNVPGLDATLYLGGAEMLAIYGFGPSMGTAANIALVSYRDTAFIGFNVDAAAVPDVDLLVECVNRGFGAVVALAE
jgi:diacylglycerol O-acyltransferase